MPHSKILLISLFICYSICAQHNNTQAATYNIISGAVIGLIGAMINKKPSQKLHKAALKGMGQGALGGYVVFESKRLIRNFADTGNYVYVWPSKLINSAGNSIILNASSNRDFWERWYINIGFGHFEYDFIRSRPLQVRIMPFSFLGGLYSFTRGNLDFKRSLYTGNLVFVTWKPTSEYSGLAILNHILIDKSLLSERKNAIAHELIHTYQYEDLMGINAYFDKSWETRINENKFWKEYDTLFYNDWNGLIHTLDYSLQVLTKVPHGNRYQEKEAYFYSINSKNK